MGTAYTAVAMDSGFIESNPAASSVLRDTQLAFYHHNWISDSKLEGVVYTVRFDDLGIGVGGKLLYVPFTYYNEWGATGPKGYVSESVATLNVSYNFFQSYYFYGLAAGMNLKAAYRSIPEAFSAGQSTLALLSDFGVRTSFNFLKFFNSRDRNVSLGATVRNLGFSTIAGEQAPLTASAGLAYSPLRPWTIAYDFNYPFSLDPVNSPAEQWSMAFGTNVNVTGFISIQAGLLLKPSNPHLSLGTSIDLGYVNFVANYNLDMSGTINPEDKFSLQAQFDLGDFGRGATEAEVDRLYLAGVEEYAKGNLEQAIEYWKKVLEMDPKYTPARDNILTTRRSLDLQREIESREIE
jgi:tetratricopeptide (TPR) repeat protein